MGFAVGNERIIAALGAREVLSRLRRVHAGAGRRDRRAQRAGRLHPRDARDLQAPARRAGRELRPRRLGGAAAARLDVRLGADSGAVTSRSAASSSPSSWSRRPRSRSRPAPASASAAKASCASRWSRTSSASARPRATSAGSLKPAAKRCTTSSLSPNGADAPHQQTTDDGSTAETRYCRPRHGRHCGRAMIAQQQAALTARCGRPIEVVAVSARSRSKKRAVDLRRLRWVSDPVRAGGRSRDRRLRRADGRRGRSGAMPPSKAALKAGKSVVTANKALLARHGVELAALAEKNGVALNFEAAVGGAHPDREDAARRPRRQFARRASTASSTAPATTS